MLEGLFGNKTAEIVLMYLQNYEEGNATEIASNFSVALNMVQKQLGRLEEAGILVSQLKGRTRVYYWNPRYPFLGELRDLLAKAFKFISEEQIKKFYRKRTRPRRQGKPL